MHWRSGLWGPTAQCAPLDSLDRAGTRVRTDLVLLNSRANMGRLRPELKGVTTRALPQRNQRVDSNGSYVLHRGACRGRRLSHVRSSPLDQPA